MKSPKLEAIAPLRSPFSSELPVKPPDPLGPFKRSFGLLGTPFGVWGGRRQARFDLFKAKVPK